MRLAALSFALLVISAGIYGQSTETKIAPTSTVEQCADIATCKRLAEGGDTQAQYLVGKWYQYRDNSDQHYEEAAKWYKLAAAGGHREAQFLLANLYFMGQGVPASYSSYFKWLEKSAQGGYPNAEYLLGEHYALSLYGNFMMKDPDYKEAFKWFLKAAEHGHVFGQSKVGYYYMKGLGEKKDLVKAYFWLGLARNRNMGPASLLLETNKKRFSADVVAKGEELIKQWQLDHPNESPVNLPKSATFPFP